MKKLMKKKVSLFGKEVSVLLVALVAMSVVSAALLSYFGVITGSVTAEQSIVLDDGDWYDDEVTDDIGHQAPGGEEFCFEHTLTNRMSVPGSVSLLSEITGPCSDLDMPGECEALNCDWENNECVETGISVCQAELLKEEIHITGDVEAYVTKVWACEDVTWNYEFISENPNGNKYTLGLVISLDQVKPDFNVWIDDSDLEWHYQEFDRVTDTWYGNTIDLPDWISVGGGSTGQTKSISIDPDYLGITDDCDQSFYWATQVRTNVMEWYGTYDWGADVSGFVENVLKVSLDDPLELESGEVKKFCNCYDFDMLIMPGDYKITTKVIPTA